MNRDEFLSKLDEASNTLDFEYIDDVLLRSLSPKGEKFKGFMNLIIAVEEFAECQQEVTKYLRNKGSHAALLEETADALIGIRYIQKILDISDEELIKAVNIKINRQSDRLAGKLNDLDSRNNKPE